jgi:hypothetical protein
MFYRVPPWLSRWLVSLVKAAVFGDAAAGTAVPAWLAAAGEADVDEAGAPEPPAVLQQAVRMLGAGLAWAGNDIRRRVHLAVGVVAAGDAWFLPGRLFGL